MKSFELNQAFTRIAKDSKRMQASDIFSYLERFVCDGQANIQDSCHFIIRYWGQDGSSVNPTS